jgi:lipopolysaccharide export system protein LptA
MAVARGNAVVVTSDGRRLAADTLVAYTAPNPPGAQQAGPSAPSADNPLGTNGKLEKVEAYGNVSVRTATDTVTGDRGVYVPETGIARLGGKVRITRGQNQLDGSEAEVNLKTGIARLLSGTGSRVQGLVVPNDSTNQGLAAPGNAAAPAGPGNTAAPGPGKAAAPGPGNTAAPGPGKAAAPAGGAR